MLSGLESLVPLETRRQTARQEAEPGAHLGKPFEPGAGVDDRPVIEPSQGRLMGMAIDKDPDIGIPGKNGLRGLQVVLLFFTAQFGGI